LRPLRGGRVAGRGIEGRQRGAAMHAIPAASTQPGLYRSIIRELTGNSTTPMT
jgi:hypothetical protein